MNRAVTNVVIAHETAEGAGARVRRALPSSGLRSLDPFVLLDEFFVEPPAAFPEHPHRGFEIVTYVLEGSFRHQDSMGVDSTVETGGVQRINTGGGIWHSEMPRTEGMNHGLQLWINLPRALKQSQPEYQGLSSGQLPEAGRAGYRVRTIVGGASPVRLHTPVEYYDVSVAAGRDCELEVTPGYSGAVYVLSGSGRFGANAITGRPGALLVLGEGDSLRAANEGNEPLRFALIAGRPHGEPIRIHGSFVD